MNTTLPRVMRNKEITYERLQRVKTKKLALRDWRQNKSRLAFIGSHINRSVKENPVLDVGCREGIWLLELRKCGFQDLYGIDVSAEAVLRARANGVSAAIGDIEDSPELDNAFSLITIIHTLEHTERPQVAVDNIKRMLKPKGLLFIEVPFERNAMTPREEVGHFSLFKEPKDVLSLLTGFKKMKQERRNRDYLVLVRKR